MLKQLFNLLIDLAIPRDDGSYIVYLRDKFRVGYYVDKFDPIGKEAVLGLALYDLDGNKKVQLGNPMRVTAKPIHGPVLNQADIDAAVATQESLQSQLDALSASLAAKESDRALMLAQDPNADTTVIDNEIATLKQQVANTQAQLDAVVVPQPQYEWTLDFDTLVTMAPNLQLTPEFLQFAANIRTSFGLRIGDFVDIQTTTP